MSNIRRQKITKDSEGNEFVETTFQSFRRDPQNYFSLYNDGLTEVLKEVTSIIELKVFLALCMKAAFNNNVVSLNKAEKDIIANDLQCSVGSVGNALSGLCKKGFLKNLNGNFTISPGIFWKGDTKKRLALINSKSKSALFNCRDSFLSETSLDTIDVTEPKNAKQK
jgi:hypothetical protein